MIFFSLTEAPLPDPTPTPPNTLKRTRNRPELRFHHLLLGPLNGGVSNGGGFPIWTCPSLFVLFCPFWDFPDFSGIFPICSGMVRGFSRFVPFLFLGLLRAPTRNSPERVRDTIWTFPEKSGKHPGLETPRFSFPQVHRGSVNGGFQTVVRVRCGEQIPAPPFNLDLTSILPLFYLNFTLFNLLKKKTSFKPLLSRQSRTTVWKPRFTDPWVQGRKRE